MRSLTEFFRLIMLCFGLAFACPAFASSPLSIDTDGDGIESIKGRSDALDSLICYQYAIPMNAPTLSSPGIVGFANEI